jgi:enoyl-CoA hydratase
MDDVITIEQDGSVAIATLNRPEALNASNEALHGRLATVWGDLAALPDVRAVVLTGAGDAFSAGGDLALLQRMVEDPALRGRILNEAASVVRAIVDFPLPLIAAVNGPAVGLGCSLAGFADLVVMEEDAFLADPHVALGLVAGDGSVLSWPSHIGLQRTKEWVLLGGRIKADEALRIGLANRVVPPGEARAAGIELAKRVARLPAQAVRGTLHALDEPLRRRLSDDLPRVLEEEGKSFDEPEFQKNLQAMLERSGA